MRDNVLPSIKWEFNQEVADAFDDMLARSIPQYEVMRSTVFGLGSPFVGVRPGTSVVDLGCSRGEALAPFVDRFGAFNDFVGIDVSLPMLEAARKRFAEHTFSDVVHIRELDLRKAYPPVRASLTLSILTLQFTPIEYRQRIVRNVFEHTTTGGAFILVEKVMGSSAVADDSLTRHYLASKATAGYSEEQIERKRLSLEGVLVPVTSRWNEELLHAAGFRHVECFWRWCNFAGWLAVKE